jgi:hypothetical protein
MLIFIVIKDETEKMCVVSPVTHHNLKKELENRDFFFSIYKVTKKYKTLQNRVSSWLASFENLTKHICLTHLDVFNGLSG